MTNHDIMTVQFNVAHLVTTYNVAWDEGRFDDVAACFTEEGTFLDGMGDLHRGRAAIAEFGERSMSIFGAMRHLTTNHVVAPNGPTWIHRCYLYFVSGIGNEKAAATGHYDDEFVLTDSGPLFTARRVYLD